MDAPGIAVVRKLEAVATALENAVTVGAEYYANGWGAARPGVAKHFTAGNQERYGWMPLSAKYAEAKARGIVHMSPGVGLHINAEGRQVIGGVIARRQAEIKALGPVSRSSSEAGKRLDAIERKRKVAAIRKKYQPELDAYVKFYTKGRLGSKLDTHAGKGKLDASIFGATASHGIQGTNLPMLVRSGALRDAVTTVKHRIERKGDTALIYFDGLPPYARFLQEGTGKMPRRSPVDPNAADEEEIRSAMQRFLDAQLGTGKATVAVSATTIPGQARMAP